MPDFQAFARKITYALNTTTLASDGSLVLDLDVNETLLQAERHARLLQQIWEWANRSYEPGKTEITIGELQAKGYIQSLLVSQTDK